MRRGNRWAQVLVLGAFILWGGEFIADRWVWNRMATFGTIAPVSDGRPPRHDAHTLCQVARAGLADVLGYDDVLWLCLPEKELPPLFKKMPR